LSRPRRRAERRPSRPAHDDRTSPHVVAGARAIAELVEHAPSRVHEIVAAFGRDDDVLERARALGIAIRRVSPAELARLSPDGPSKGLVALAQPPAPAELDDLVDAALGADARGVLVALDGVLDPHNLGAILRSAEFFGCQGAVWARDRSAPLSPAAVRASAGASERLPHAIVTNLVRALEQCRERGLWIVGTVADGGRPLADARTDLPERLVVVLGGEEGGLRRLTRERCDFLVTIPGKGAMASLNVAAAAAVVLASLA
jgi:23S rRNA (guanosine2251-2'-O)-methyltransferase